jgi:hypothetical protein
MRKLSTKEKKKQKNKWTSIHMAQYIIWGGCQNLYSLAAFSTHTKREIDQSNKNGDATWMKKLSSVSLFLGETDVKCIAKMKLRTGKEKGWYQRSKMD